jgi:hypothetical protein
LKGAQNGQNTKEEQRTEKKGKNTGEGTNTDGRTHLVATGRRKNTRIGEMFVFCPHCSASARFDHLDSGDMR